MEKVKLGPKHYLFPQPTVIVGAIVEGQPNYLTAAWSGIMQAQPPLIYVALNRVRYTLRGIKENGCFSVNIPSCAQARETDYVGMVSGHNENKSKIFTAFYGELKEAPMIEECPINMECRILQILDFGGTHEICVGSIVQTYGRTEILTDGVPDIKKIDPIIFATGTHGYYRVGDFLAKAFKVWKEYEKK